mgnify:FL=1|tara:strand:+ start:17461 stop:17799 length:339 start_codon:yes stop_codon:yes gene_type:complete
MFELICEDWHLYDYQSVTITKSDAATGFKYQDIKMEAKCIRVYGTKEQIEETGKDYNIDEAYEFKVEQVGSYWHTIYGSEAEKINTEVNQKLEKYKELYKANNNKLLIIRTR